MVVPNSMLMSSLRPLIASMLRTATGTPSAPSHTLSWPTYCLTDISLFADGGIGTSNTSRRAGLPLRVSSRWLARVAPSSWRSSTGA